jgi:hypothetical protein
LAGSAVPAVWLLDSRSCSLALTICYQWLTECGLGRVLLLWFCPLKIRAGIRLAAVERWTLLSMLLARRMIRECIVSDFERISNANRSSKYAWSRNNAARGTHVRSCRFCHCCLPQYTFITIHCTLLRVSMHILAASTLPQSTAQLEASPTFSQRREGDKEHTSQIW